MGLGSQDKCKHRPACTPALGRWPSRAGGRALLMGFLADSSSIDPLPPPPWTGLCLPEPHTEACYTVRWHVDRVLWEGSGSWERSLHSGIRALRSSWERSLPPHPVGTRPEDGRQQTGKRFLTRNRPGRHLAHGLPTSRSVRNKLLLFQPQCVVICVGARVVTPHTPN